MKHWAFLISKTLLVLSLVFSFTVNAGHEQVSCSQIFASHEKIHNKILNFLNSLKLNLKSKIKPDVEIQVTPGASERFKDLALAKKLISQTDSRLKQRELLLPNHGLCGPTCGVNLLHALFSYSNAPTIDFEHKPDYFIQQIIGKSMTTFHWDARKGMHNHQLIPILSGIVGKLTGNPYNLRASTKSVFNYDDINLDSFVIDEDSLTLATVTTGPNSGHFIIILHFDPRTNKLVYADPNRPDKIFSTNWIASKFDGYSTINMAWNKKNGARNGWIMTLTKMKLALRYDKKPEPESF